MSSHEVDLISRLARWVAVFRRKCGHLSDPRIIGYKLQRYFRTPGSRRAMRDLVSAVLRSRSNGEEPSREVREMAGELDVRGIARLPGSLTEAQLEQMRQALHGVPCHDPLRPELGTFSVENPPPETHFAQLDRVQVVQAPHVLALANRPELLRAFEAYHGCRPLIDSIQAWWSYPGHTAPEGSGLFHRDIEGYAILKLFLYLTDVDESTGPHVFVAGSLHDERFRAYGHFTDEEVVAVFGAQALETITGKAGTSFLSDTSYLHKGLPPRSGRRLILQVQYTQCASPDLSGIPLPRSSELPADLRSSLDARVNRRIVKFD